MQEIGNAKLRSEILASPLLIGLPDCLTATRRRFSTSIRRLATSIPQRLSFENRVIRDSRTLAAS
jgi:hypothetical protein